MQQINATKSQIIHRSSNEDKSDDNVFYVPNEEYRRHMNLLEEQRLAYIIERRLLEEEQRSEYPF